MARQTIHKLKVYYPDNKHVHCMHCVHLYMSALEVGPCNECLKHSNNVTLNVAVRITCTRYPSLVILGINEKVPPNKQTNKQTKQNKQTVAHIFSSVWHLLITLINSVCLNMSTSKCFWFVNKLL